MLDDRVIAPDQSTIPSNKLVLAITFGAVLCTIAHFVRCIACVSLLNVSVRFNLNHNGGGV